MKFNRHWDRLFGAFPVVRQNCWTLCPLKQEKVGIAEVSGDIASHRWVQIPPLPPPRVTIGKIVGFFYLVKKKKQDFAD
jgi:hypothetical protein